MISLNTQKHLEIEMAIMKLCLLFLVFLSVISRSSSSSSSFVCEENSDCKALVEFKKGVTSDPNGHLKAWTEANPFCNWTGVTCHPDRIESRVVALRLEGKGLRGGLSSSLGQLSEMVRLNLSYNNFQGRIPGSLQGCRGLKFLDLSSNNLTGFVPEEIGKMKSLTFLVLSDNDLSGSVSSWLSNLTELTRLELSVNKFSGRIPTEIGELRKLEILYLHINYLEGEIPSSLSNCTALREIAMNQNFLRGEIPSDLGLKLKGLEKFYAIINELSGNIPKTLSNLSWLTLLDLSWNKLTGAVPWELGKLKNLEILYLHSNLFDYSSLDFLTALTNCSRLKKLHLASCFFAGKIPDSVGGLSQELFYFNLLNNRITGDLPESIGNLTGLVNLNLYYNFLTGKIPSTLEKLKNLQMLNLARNEIGGPIPESLGSMRNLGLLDLSNNSITGPIPRSLCNSPQMRYVYLSHNRLSGNFPAELARCSLLLSLDLSHNRLRGSIPSRVGLFFPNLAFFLNLSSNAFEGNVPESIGRLKSLEAIDLSENGFSGEIPSSIGGCVALEYLNLSRNSLRGPIPESLSRIVSLEALDLSRNELNGSVPAWIANKTKIIKALNLSYNMLSGKVPIEFLFGKSSLIGNPKLCGGSPKLSLPRCKKKKKKNTVFYAVSVVIFVFVLFVVISSILWFVFLRQKHKRNGDTMLKELPNIPGRRIYTQRELEIATSGFDETNLLGRGSFGSVYKGTLDGNTFAVKVFRREFDLRADKSLKREFKILSEIRHRNLVGLVGSAWNAEFKALVLELVPNGNLERHLYPPESDELCELTMRERVSIAMDVANGLEYLHEGCPSRVVHCDVKPRNVLLDNEMSARIADFGIGKLCLDRRSEASSGSTSLVIIRGSVGYIPPEYGEGREVSAKGDVYSFGVMLMEMVTRKRPTSEIFGDGLDMRKWVVSSLPSNVLGVVDLTLKKQAALGGSVGSLERLEKCCVELINVALACTEAKPQERPTMACVVPMLLHVWKDMGF